MTRGPNHDKGRTGAPGAKHEVTSKYRDVEFEKLQAAAKRRNMTVDAFVGAIVCGALRKGSLWQLTLSFDVEDEAESARV